MEDQNLNRRSAIKIMTLGAGSILIGPGQIGNSILQMNTRLIPSSQESIPVIGLGTWQTFDVGRSDAERNPLKEVLQILVEHGGSVIDSSPMYGRSEQVVGELTTSLGLKGKIFEATKVWTTGEKEGKAEIRRSMDLMQVHNLVDWRTQIETLKELKDAGKVRYIGVTHYHSGGYAEMERVMKSEPLDFMQINYNLAVRGAAERLLPLAQDLGIGVIINRPYEGGALFRKLRDIALPEWAEEFGASSWGQFFLKYILAHPSVSCVIPGTAKAKHMKDNVGAGFGALPTQKHLKKMEAYFN